MTLIRLYNFYRRSGATPFNAARRAIANLTR